MIAAFLNPTNLSNSCTHNISKMIMSSNDNTPPTPSSPHLPTNRSFGVSNRGGRGGRAGGRGSKHSYPSDSFSLADYYGTSQDRKRQRRQAAGNLVSGLLFQNNNSNPGGKVASSASSAVATAGAPAAARKKASTAQPRPSIKVLPRGIGPIRDPNCNDVLSGRGGRINAHPGNVQFRNLVQSKKKVYLDLQTKKLEKAHIAAQIVEHVRTMDPPGRFLKEDADGSWYDIGDAKAIKKVGQALREDAPDIRQTTPSSSGGGGGTGKSGGGDSSDDDADVPPVNVPSTTPPVAAAKDPGEFQQQPQPAPVTSSDSHDDTAATERQQRHRMPPPATPTMSNTSAGLVSQAAFPQERQRQHHEQSFSAIPGPEYNKSHAGMNESPVMGHYRQHHRQHHQHQHHHDQQPQRQHHAHHEPQQHQQQAYETLAYQEITPPPAFKQIIPSAAPPPSNVVATTNVLEPPAPPYHSHGHVASEQQQQQQFGRQPTSNFYGGRNMIRGIMMPKAGSTVSGAAAAIMKQQQHDEEQGHFEVPPTRDIAFGRSFHVPGDLQQEPSNLSGLSGPSMVSGMSGVSALTDPVSAISDSRVLNTGHERHPSHHHRNPSGGNTHAVRINQLRQQWVTHQQPSNSNLSELTSNTRQMLQATAAGAYGQPTSQRSLPVHDLPLDSNPPTNSNLPVFPLGADNSLTGGIRDDSCLAGGSAMGSVLGSVTGGASIFSGMSLGHLSFPDRGSGNSISSRTGPAQQPVALQGPQQYFTSGASVASMSIGGEASLPSMPNSVMSDLSENLVALDLAEPRTFDRSVRDGRM